jgi:hypothetical protein
LGRIVSELLAWVQIEGIKTTFIRCRYRAMWHQASLESLWAVNTWRQKTIPNPVNAIIDVATVAAAAATASNERSSMARLSAMSLSLHGGLAHGDTDVSERSVLPPSITSSGQPQNP